LPSSQKLWLHFTLLTLPHSPHQRQTALIQHANPSSNAFAPFSGEIQFLGD